MGKQYAKSFESTYAQQYKNNLLSVSEKYLGYDETSLSSVITEKALADGREEL